MTKSKEIIYQVDLGYACFGLIAKDGKVIDVAPIAKWMKGKLLSEIKPWLISKKAKVTQTPTEQLKNK